jgi:cytochrome c553
MFFQHSKQGHCKTDVGGGQTHETIWRFRTLMTVTLIAASLASCHRADRTQLAAGEALALQGRDGVAACNGCHGQKGEGNLATGFPRLAGLHANYIAKQLRDFARATPKTGVHFEPIARDYSKTPRIDLPLTILTPGIRRDAMMGPIAKTLTEDEIDNLARYYSRLPFTAQPRPGDPETLERGEDLVLRGKPEYGLPGCFACHGQNGGGVGAVFPPIAGQPPQYLIGQINKWQTGERDNDENALMRSIAVQLTDGDKHYVAAYLANLSHEAKAD